MAVPKFFEFFRPFLASLQDGGLHNVKEVRSRISEDMKLSQSDLAEMLPSGRQATFDNRVNWAKTYLQKAGLIENPRRGQYQITIEGQKALASREKLDVDFLTRYESFRLFHGDISDKSTDEDTSAMPPTSVRNPDDSSPMDTLELGFKKINENLAAELMDEIMRLTPIEFEKLVVKLLLKMGYGNGIAEAGMTTQQSNDEGIDGIIKEDQLGFSNIYIQAKKWSQEQTVGKPEIQKFVGALHGQQAQKGLFITTTRFSNGAMQYAENLSSTVKVVLVDGSALTKLMIKHNVGVSVEQVYEVKKLDSDFFADEL